MLNLWNRWTQPSSSDDKRPDLYRHSPQATFVTSATPMSCAGQLRVDSGQAPCKSHHQNQTIDVISQEMSFLNHDDRLRLDRKHPEVKMEGFHTHPSLQEMVRCFDLSRTHHDLLYSRIQWSLDLKMQDLIEHIDLFFSDEFIKVFNPDAKWVQRDAQMKEGRFSMPLQVPGKERHPDWQRQQEFEVSVHVDPASFRKVHHSQKGDGKLFHQIYAAYHFYTDDQGRTILESHQLREMDIEALRPRMIPKTWVEGAVLKAAATELDRIYDGFQKWLSELNDLPSRHGRGTLTAHSLGQPSLLRSQAELSSFPLKKI